MRKFLLTLITLCLTITQLKAEWWNPFSGEYTCAFWGPGSCSSSPWPSPINLDAAVGYRVDTFRWRRGQHEKGPDLWSELQWKDLRIIEFGGSASYVSCRNYTVKAWGSYGHIYHGENIDSDFFEDRSREDNVSNSRKKDLISRSLNDGGKGCVYDASAGVGYRVTSSCRRFIGTPLIGYSNHEQHLHIFGGNQVVSRLGLQPLGRFPGLNSRYKTRWFGPWAGLDFTTQVEKCAYVFGSFEWHLLSYRASGCWNLRADRGPFYHRAHGFGYLTSLGTKWEFCRNWSIGVMAAYRNFRTRGGKEKTTLIDPVFGHRRIVERFNGAKWHTWSIAGIIAWRY